MAGQQPQAEEPQFGLEQAETEVGPLHSLSSSSCSLYPEQERFRSGLAAVADSERPLVEAEAVVAAAVRPAVDSAGRLVDGVALKLAFASASRGYDVSPLEQDHRQDTEHPYIDDSG
mmetsp:Transcript_52927/g.79060  ORF Transcript_52927/g.79060 Transcript_52927/m.79060 type:complete len:117 (+) Transcript_52927:381-731(+)